MALSYLNIPGGCRPHNKLDPHLMNHSWLIRASLQNDQTLAGISALKGSDLPLLSASEFWRVLASSFCVSPTLSHSLQPLILGKPRGKVSQIQDFKGAISLANMLYSWQVLKNSASIKCAFRTVNYKSFQSFKYKGMFGAWVSKTIQTQSSLSQIAKGLSLLK